MKLKAGLLTSMFVMGLILFSVALVSTVDVLTAVMFLGSVTIFYFVFRALTD